MGSEFTSTRLILIFHALAGCSVLAVSIHLLVAALRGRGIHGRRFRHRAAMYARILWPITLATFFTGGVIYPAFRVGVRASYLDEQRPAFTGLFEIKEHWGAMALVLSIALWRLYRLIPSQPDRFTWLGQTSLTAVIVIISAYNVIAGFLLVMVRSLR